MGFCGQSRDKWIYLICHIQPEIRRYCRFYYHYYYYSAPLQGLGDLSSPFRDWASAPAVESQLLHHQGIPVTFRKFFKTLKTYSFCLVVFTPLGLSSLSHPSLLKHPLSCSLMETYRAFLWALIPCKHRLPGQNLHCVSEDLFSASSVKHCPPRVVFLWNLCLTTQDFNSSQDSAGPIRCVLLWQPLSARVFWEVLY